MGDYIDARRVEVAFGNPRDDPCPMGHAPNPHNFFTLREKSDKPLGHVGFPSDVPGIWWPRLREQYISNIQEQPGLVTRQFGARNPCILTSPR